MNDRNIADDIPQRAVSLYGQGEGMDDFPVLKAFQQYIDAEQEKARKRVMGLGIFFGAILVAVIIVFMVLLHGINSRNQALSDRLVEYAMKEAERHQTVVQPVPQNNDATLKAITDTLATMQQKMLESSDNVQRQQVQVDTPKVSEESAKIEREKMLLEAERKRLAEEKARLHEIEVDRQRRKLYPELYEDKSAGLRRQTPSRPKTRTLTDEDIREIIREAYPDGVGTKQSATTKATKETTPSDQADSSESADDEEAIEYFKDDEYTIPIDVKGTSSKVKFTVPVD